MRVSALIPLVAVFVLGACADGPVAETGPPPNILLLLLDDMGVETIGAYNPSSSHTPHLDALAAQGVRFTAAWASPFCEPARAALQTGRYGFRTGVGAVGKGGLPLEEVTLAEMLELGSEGVYATAAIGKWHLAGENNGKLDSPNLAGYDHFAGTMGNLDDYFEYRKVTDGVSRVRRGYATSDQAKDAIDWIGAASEPWFCYVAFNAVHHPLHTPPPRMHSVQLPKGDPRAIGEAMFIAMIESIDHAVGRIIDGLTPDVRERTTIIVLADNGSNRYHLAGPVEVSAGKGTVMQSGVHVPLIIAGATVTAPGRTTDALVDITDIFATVADLAGVDLDRVHHALSGPLDSISLAPYLLSPNAPHARATVFAESFRPNGPGPYVNTRRALRDERYKLIALHRSNGVESEELYDLIDDSGETRDLLKLAPDSPPVRRAHEHLRSELLRLLASE